MTAETPRRWSGLDVIVDTKIPAGYAELRDKDGQVVVTLKLDGRHLAIAPARITVKDHLDASEGDVDE